MTKKEIIAMAEESGFSKQGRAPAYYAMPDEIERFAALIASRVAAAAKAEEREACAVIAETAADCLQNSTFEGVAISIRARGEAK